MIIKSKTNENTYIEVKDRITAGVRDRFLFMQTPKLQYNANGEAYMEMKYLNEYESNPNLYLLSKVVEKIVQDGEDITPKNDKVSSLIEVLDTKFYDHGLLKETTETVLKTLGFLEEEVKIEEEEKKESDSSVS